MRNQGIEFIFGKFENLFERENAPPSIYTYVYVQYVEVDDFILERNKYFPYHEQYGMFPAFSIVLIFRV